MKVFPAACFVVFASGLGVCSLVGANAPVTSAGSEKGVLSERSASIGNLPRRRSVQGVLTLTESVNLALRQNPEVLRAIREVERSHGQMVEVRAQALPRFGVTGSLDRYDGRLLTGGANTPGVQKTSWNVIFELKQTIYSGGAVTASIKAAKLTQDASYYGLRDTLDRTVSEVRKQFAAVLVTEALIGVAEESVDLALKQLEDAKNRFAAGTVPRFNVLRAEVEVASLRPSLIRAKNDFLIARLQLAKLLGLDASPNGKPEFHCVGELLVEGRNLDLADAIKLGRARRASLKGQREQILIEKERIKVAMAGFKPKVEAHLDYEFRNRYNSASFDNAVSGYFMGVTGRWDIFSGFETTGQVSQAKARLESALVTYEDAMQQVELEVQKSYADLQQFRETIESQQKNVQEALEALRLSQERLSAGAGTQLEVLDARVALTRARNTELQAKGDYVRSLAEFDRATALSTSYEDSFKDPLSVLEKALLRQAPVELFKP